MRILDIHTHILPAIDDGSKDASQSIRMLELQAAQGVSAVALTPHYSASREAPAEFIRRRRVSEQALLKAIHDRQRPRRLPHLLPGAEVAYFDGMSRCEDIDLLCIGRTGAMLIEMPFGKWNQRVLNEIEELQRLRGIQPILAHIERYLAWQPESLIRELREGGVLIQVNTSFVTGWQSYFKATSLIKQQCIHFVASDCHDLQHRPPNLGETMQKLEKRFGRQKAEHLLRGTVRLMGG